MTMLTAPITVYTQTSAAGFDWTQYDCSPNVPKDATIAWIWVTATCSGVGNSCIAYVRQNSLATAQRAVSIDPTAAVADVSSNSCFVPVLLDPTTQKFEFKATVVTSASLTIEFRAYQ